MSPSEPLAVQTVPQVTLAAGACQTACKKRRRPIPTIAGESARQCR
jgi:hypothetical protein